MVNQMSKLPWFPMYAGDWFLSTAEMSNAEKGAYIDLLCMQWDNGSILKVPTRYLKEWDTLEDKFVKNGDGRYINQRLDKIRISKHNALEKQILGGIESGKVRGKVPTKQPTATRARNQSQSQSQKTDSESKKKSAATEVPAPYLVHSLMFINQQVKNFPKESAWEEFDKRVTEGAKQLYLFHTQNGWTEEEIYELLEWILTDDFWRSNIRTLGGIRQRKSGGAMKFENAKAAMESSKPKGLNLYVED